MIPIAPDKTIRKQKKNELAVDFYNPAGGKAEKVVHFNFSTKLERLIEK